MLGLICCLPSGDDGVVVWFCYGLWGQHGKFEYAYIVCAALMRCKCLSSDAVELKAFNSPVLSGTPQSREH